ncbi:N-acetylglucosamine-6-phosphate deacetylase [Candidatus Bipolaricaulota bacterium]|nr:N-acetylglucosamine-6-phosphate deacetylase [Candidatus Bipolaricaulota bacterium]
MNELILANGRVIFPGREEVKITDVAIRDGKIDEIGPELPDNTESKIDLDGSYLSPGFIDLQVNGGYGVDFLTCEPGDIGEASDFWLEHGTTSFLGTIITHPIDSMNGAVSSLARTNAPNLFGVHVEGPFLSYEKRGTHNPAHLKKPTRENFRRIISGAERSVKLFTFAPELDGTEDLLNWIEANNSVPSIGHSDADYDTINSFLDRGVSSFTHLFNGMKGFHHREPGTAGAALVSDSLVGIIADGMHLHPGAVRFVEKMKGSDEIYLVTDAIAAAGLEDGKYVLGNQEITVEDGLAKIDNGTIAGSTLTMESALKNYIEFTGIPLAEAIKTVTLNPAKLLGREKEIGSMEPGSKADLVTFDEEFRVDRTIIDGEVVFDRDTR